MRLRQVSPWPVAHDDLDGLTVTTVATTAVDLLRWGAGPADEAALAWLWGHGTSPRQAGALLRLQRGCGGVRRAREALAAARRGAPHPLSDLRAGQGAGQVVRLPVIR